MGWGALRHFKFNPYNPQSTEASNNLTEHGCPTKNTKTNPPCEHWAAAGDEASHGLRWILSSACLLPSPRNLRSPWASSGTVPALRLTATGLPCAPPAGRQTQRIIIRQSKAGHQQVSSVHSLHTRLGDKHREPLSDKPKQVIKKFLQLPACT